MNRVTVTCPNGHPIRTTVRGRGTTCRECKTVVYVRLDGTARHADPEPPAVAEPSVSGGPEWGTRRGWGRRFDDVESDAVDVARYDPVVKRTALWGEDGEYLGYTFGDPYDLAE